MDTPIFHRHIPTMKWTIEFMGEQRPLAEVWNEDVARIIGPVREQVSKAFETANEPDVLLEIEVVFFVDDEQTWGVRFCGDPLAVQYATDLVKPVVSAPRKAS